MLQPEVSRILAAPDGTELIGALFVPDAVEAMIQLGHLRGGRAVDRHPRTQRPPTRSPLDAGRGHALPRHAGRRPWRHEHRNSHVPLAIAQHQRLPMPFEQARTLLLLGQLQRRQRRRDAATTTLREAQHTFEKLGTTLWAQRASTELTRGTSGRQRTPGLTPSERRVAELAVAGMTNRDIAAALFISPKTSRSQPQPHLPQTQHPLPRPAVQSTRAPQKVGKTLI